MKDLMGDMDARISVAMAFINWNYCAMRRAEDNAF